MDGTWEWTVTTYKWFKTPHLDDGYWVEYVYRGSRQNEKWYPVKDAPAIDLEKTPYPYPFSQYRWEWPGIEMNAKTWYAEDFPGKALDKPARQIRLPSYSTSWPGQRNNL